MTLDDFLNELKLTRKANKTYFYGPTIRCKDDELELQYCPITYLCQKKIGKFYSTSCYMGAARELELYRGDAMQLSAVADGKVPYGSKYFDLRIKLLEAAGLSVSI